VGKRENKVEVFLDEQICRMGGATYKFVSPGKRYVPDRIVMLYGIVWFVEVKALGEVATPGQEREIAKLKKQGMNACYVSGIRGVKDFLNKEFNFK